MAEIERKLMNSTENPGGPAQSEENDPATEAAALAGCESQFSTKSVVILVALALLCAGAGWGWGELTHNLFPWDSAYVFNRYRDEIDKQPSELRNGYMNSKVLSTRKVADSKNAAIVYGALGGFLSLALGLLGTYLRAQPRHAKITATAGFLLGIAAGAIPSFALVPYYFDNFNPRSTIALPFLVHFGLWAGIGAAAGMALSIGMGRWRDLGRGFIGGMGGRLRRYAAVSSHQSSPLSPGSRPSSSHERDKPARRGPLREPGSSDWFVRISLIRPSRRSNLGGQYCVGLP